MELLAQIDLDAALFFLFCKTHHLFHDSMILLVVCNEENSVLICIKEISIPTLDAGPVQLSDQQC